MKTKTILSLTPAHARHAPKLVEAMNLAFGTGDATSFTFVATPEALTATGPWELPGSQRPSMGTMAAFAHGALTVLELLP